MIEPIKAGDTCKVIYPDSANYGKTVKVVSFQGEHSKWGRIWRCEGKDLEHYKPLAGKFMQDWADIPAAWLEKALPTPVKSRQLETI
jgi:predicted oxidoreductase (fatty acid repression mutant protein)